MRGGVVIAAVGNASAALGLSEFGGAVMPVTSPAAWTLASVMHPRR